ncbi:MAG: SDR family oxidoreductase [Mycobacteriales bacterium]
MNRHVLLVGATGVVGGAAARHLAGESGWKVTVASRRDPSLDAAAHISVDLLDRDVSTAAFSALRDVTHVVYAGYVDRPSMAEAVGPNVAMLTHTLAGLECAGAPLERVVLIGGGKSYGEHLGPYKTPAKESDPRHLGPIFYNDQEDLLREDAARRGYNWTVLRPDIVIGPSTGSSMNLLTTIAAYAALCRIEGTPLRFPGSHAAWTALHQLTDADLLAEATEWALSSPEAIGEVFNVTNGDLFRWDQMWPAIAEVFDLPTAAPQPMSLPVQMAGKTAVWEQAVLDYQLVESSLNELASWTFADAVWNMGFDLVQSTIKIRQAGFTGCRDSQSNLVEHLSSLRSRHIVP